jgi:class 3 adenylate cyclase
MVTTPATERISALLDAAIEAVNKGDLATAHDLAERVLREDATNVDAEALLDAEESDGELRRLTILCCDLVGSTELSERHDPERYTKLVRRYQRIAREIIQQRFGGHIVSVKGDGFLSLFGHPVAHEDDTRRAVQAGLELCRATEVLSAQAEREFGEGVAVRVGVHRGIVFIDLEEDDVYGLTANLTSRVEGLATPGTVVVTDTVRRRVADHFAFEPGSPQHVKGVSEPVLPFTVVGERAGGRGAGTAFVGRAHEIATLRDAWASASSGAGSGCTSVLIRGEPGIGKSRLAAALAEIARDERGVVVELAGSQDHTGAGFHAVQMLLESRCGIHREIDAASRLHRLRLELGATGGDVEDTVPLLAPILGLAPSAGYEPVAAEGRKLNDAISAAVYDYLIACNGSGPGVLIVDDAQWVDESTSALLARLLADGPSTLLVVMTARGPVPLDATIVIDLDPLSADERHELLDSMGHELPPEARAALVERSDGVPLYLEELARSWDQMAGAGSVTPETFAPADSALPDALYEPLVARLLSTNAGAAVAGAAATAGRSVDREILEALLQITPEELDRELAALIDATILVPAEQPGEYRFRHGLVRTVAYELQPPTQRRRVHGRAGDLLVRNAESDEVVDWNLAAAHYERADRPHDAAGAYGHAADRAQRRGALDEARNDLGRAIELVATAPDNRDRDATEVSLRLRRGFIAMSTEGPGSAEAASDYERCLQLAMADVQSDGMFSSLISMWAYHLSRGDLARARLVSETLRDSGGNGSEEFRPTNHAGFGMVRWFEGDFAGAHEMLHAAATSVEASGVELDVDKVWFVPNDPASSIHVHCALARFTHGDTAGADAEMARTQAITAGLDFPQGAWSRAYGAWLRSWMLAERGDIDEAAAEAALIVELGTAHGFDNWGLVGATQQTAVEAARTLRDAEPDPDVASGHAAMLGMMLDAWQAVQILVFVPYYLTMTGTMLDAAGDRDGAAQRYAEAHALAERTGMRFYEAETTRRSAWLERDNANLTRLLREALAIARTQGARPFELRAALDLHRVEGGTAITLVEAAALGHAVDASSADLDAARALLGTTG